jgi:hypothetical protein
MKVWDDLKISKPSAPNATKRRADDSGYSYELVTKDGTGPRPLRWNFQGRTSQVILVRQWRAASSDVDLASCSHSASNRTCDNTSLPSLLEGVAGRSQKSTSPPATWRAGTSPQPALPHVCCWSMSPTGAETAPTRRHSREHRRPDPRQQVTVIVGQTLSQNDRRQQHGREQQRQQQRRPQRSRTAARTVMAVAQR